MRSSPRRLLSFISFIGRLDGVIIIVDLLLHLLVIFIVGLLDLFEITLIVAPLIIISSATTTITAIIISIISVKL